MKNDYQIAYLAGIIGVIGGYFIVESYLAKQRRIAKEKEAAK